ncbi:MAG: type II 3-dehydroquinate dehydratase [Silicimonas sp.]|nr:type II 3-dehydroquinate dehydratase [Silicimonas sp.]
MRILLIQGANMEWLGIRQPEVYGRTTAAELDERLQAEAADRGVSLDIRYSNIEGEAINFIYAAARDGVDGLIMNPAGFHYNAYALRDCLRGVSLPYVEVHISNIDSRGMKSVLATEAVGMISGFGLDSYTLGLEAMVRILKKRTVQG